MFCKTSVREPSHAPIELHVYLSLMRCIDFQGVGTINVHGRATGNPRQIIKPRPPAECRPIYQYTVKTLGYPSSTHAPTGHGCPPSPVFVWWGHWRRSVACDVLADLRQVSPWMTKQTYVCWAHMVASGWNETLMHAVGSCRVPK